MKTQYMRYSSCQLYRYDLNEPPKKWDIEYKSPEYITNRKSKNVANLFFFFENEFVTYMTAGEAIQKNELEKFWLTKTEIKQELRLLNLKGGGTLPMLNALFCNGINVFIDEMSLNIGNGKVKTFAELEDDYFCFMSKNTQSYESFNRLNSYFVSPGNPYSLLGQTLSDGENGIIFKQKLIEAGYDGYVFDESFGGSTICLISIEKLSSPQAECIDKPQLFKYKKEKIYGIQD